MFELLSFENNELIDYSKDIHWYPTLNEYNPEITTEKWIEPLNNKSIIEGDFVWPGALAVFK